MKAWYLQVRPDDSHGRSTEDAGDINQSTRGGRLFLRLSDYRLLHGGGGRCRSLLRLCSWHLFNGGGRGYSAPLRCRGLALQLHQKFFDSGGWTSASSRFPHCGPHALIAFLHGFRWRPLLKTKEDYSSTMYSNSGNSTTLLKITYFRRRGL
jgi:hypothetical protein